MVASAIGACVADEPGTGSSGDDTTNLDSGAGGDATFTGDGSTTHDDGSAPTDGGVDAGLCDGEIGCPAAVGGGHLQLWLRGDKGVDCVNFRAATWLDQSGHGRNATLPKGDDGGIPLAPECEVDAIHSLNVMAFNDPGDPFAPSADETYAVNLGWLKGHDFTFAIVHKEKAYIFSSALLSFALVPQPAPYSCLAPQNNGGFQLLLNHDSDAAAYYQSDIQCVTNTSNGYRAPTTMDPQLVEYQFSATTGYHIWVNGKELALSVISNGDASAANLIGVTANGGEASLIARLPSDPSLPLNTRYKGDIAEIAGYDVALSDVDRQVIETYLKKKWALTF
ncbi:MAG: hypothetical protein ABI551_27455 [Polyangiaceae bacterium]